MVGGVHLAELMVACALLGLVAAMAFTTLSQALGVYGDGVVRVEAQQNARVALERIARDVRGAGYGGSAAQFPALAATDPAALVIQMDLDGDGVVGGSGETIAWRLAGDILRRDAGGGAQPIVPGVRALRFEYLDGAGAPTADAAAVRSVRATLTAGGTHPGAGRATAWTATVMTEVRLRNR
jgi:type II secretory pathway component PulJ